MSNGIHGVRKDGLVFVSGTVADTSSGKFKPIGNDVFAYRVYLCPHCSDTHLDITVGNHTMLVTNIPVETAEALGKQLLNPSPVNPSNLEKYKG